MPLSDAAVLPALQKKEDFTMSQYYGMLINTAHKKDNDIMLLRSLNMQKVCRKISSKLRAMKQSGVS